MIGRAATRRVAVSTRFAVARVGATADLGRERGDNRGKLRCSTPLSAMPRQRRSALPRGRTVVLIVWFVQSLAFDPRKSWRVFGSPSCKPLQMLGDELGRKSQ